MSAQNDNLAKIEHIVVLMLENRSFDNILGWLYGPDNPPPRNQTFNGVHSGMCNPAPAGPPRCVGKGSDMRAPFPDPNEPYEYVYRQMYNVSPLPNPVPNTTASPSMQGFVADYAEAIAQANLDAGKDHQPPLAVDPGIIMNCFAPSSLPVINGLAQAYAVCDNWFSSVPTQTFPNRSFVHAATSSGNVYNTWKGKSILDFGVFINATPTVYNLLEDAPAKVSWKVYHGGPLLLCNALYGQKQLWQFGFTGDRFFPFSQFQNDVQSHNLPSYTFIEPNMLCSEKYGPENDMHPAYAILDTGTPTDVRYGDKLIYDVYTALRESDYYWEKTLLIITFDEHGGCFDHVPTPPPLADAPDDVVIPPDKPGGSGFDFKRFGVRVPAVLVSPWIEAGTVCHTQFDHTSVIKTVSNKWLGGESLTSRDAAASDVSEVLTLSTPRTDNPVITPVTPPAFTGCGSQPLSALHRDLLVAVAMLLAQKAEKYVHIGSLKTQQEVAQALDDLAASLLES